MEHPDDVVKVSFKVSRGLRQRLKTEAEHQRMCLSTYLLFQVMSRIHESEEVEKRFYGRPKGNATR
jgi:hypothetical protein